MKLTAQNLKAIELLASGVNGKDTSEKIGVTPETISRWRSDFAFQAELNKLLVIAQQESSDKIRHLATVALDTLETLITDTDTPPKEKLTASIKILELVNVKSCSIGSTNATVLEKEYQQDKLLESFHL